MRSATTKILSIIFILAFFMLCIGCDKTQAGENDPDGFVMQYEAPQKNLDPVSLVFYFIGTEPKDWTTVKEEIEKQIAPTINASLDFKWFEYSDYIQKINMLTASSKDFDAFCCAQPQQIYLDFTQLAREGKLKDITELFPANAPSLYAKYSQQELDYACVDGNLFAVPSLYPRAEAAYIYANAELMDSMSIGSINTFEDYDAFLQSVYEYDSSLIPGCITNNAQTLNLYARGAGYVVLDEVQRLVYKWDDPEMKIMAWEETPEFTQITDRLASWYKDGLLVNDSDNPQTMSFLFYGDLMPPTEETQVLTYGTGPDDHTDPLRVFYLYPEQTVQRQNPMGSFYRNGSFVFCCGSLNTERALMFLDWVQYSYGNYKLMMYGIENTHYVMGEEGPGLPEGMEFDDRTYFFWDGSWAMRNLEYITYHLIGQENEWEPIQFLDQYSRYPPHGAFYANLALIQGLADARAEEFRDFERNMRTGLITDTADIDEFIGGMEDLGTANLIETVQDQLDAWMDSHS